MNTTDEQTVNMLRDTAKQIRAWAAALMAQMHGAEGILTQRAFERRVRLLEIQADAIELGGR